MTIEIVSLLDCRVPQPGREHEYGVPEYIVDAVSTLYRTRNTASDRDVETIDATILRIYHPWLRPC